MRRESYLQGTPAPRWTCAEAEKRVDSWHRLSRCAVKGEGWARPPGPRRRGTATQGTGSAEGPGGREGLAGSRAFSRGRSVANHRVTGSAVPAGRERLRPTNRASLGVSGHRPPPVRSGPSRLPGRRLGSSAWGAERGEG